MLVSNLDVRQHIQELQLITLVELMLMEERVQPVVMLIKRIPKLGIGMILSTGKNVVHVHGLEQSQIMDCQVVGHMQTQRNTQKVAQLVAIFLMVRILVEHIVMVGIVQLVMDNIKRTVNHRHGAAPVRITINGVHMALVHISMMMLLIQVERMLMEENVPHVIRFIKRIVRLEHMTIIHHNTGEHVLIQGVLGQEPSRITQAQHTIMEEHVRLVVKYIKLTVQLVLGLLMHQITGRNVHTQVVQEHIAQLHIQHQVRFRQMRHITGKSAQHVHIK